MCDLTLTHGDGEAAVLCCDFSPDSKWLLTGDTQCSVKVGICIYVCVCVCVCV